GRRRSFVWGRKPRCFLCDGHGKVSRCSNEHGKRFGIMLTLGNEIRSNEDWVARFQQNDSLCRSRQHVGAAVKSDELLSCSYKRIARSDDLLHVGDGLCAIGQSSNCLRASNPIKFAYSEHGSSGQGCWLWIWRHDTDFTHSSHLSRYDGHEQG